MPEIRHLEARDLPQVQKLLEEGMPHWGAPPRFLLRTLIEDPWHEDEFGSLVAVDDGGAVVGFLGGQTRRLRFGSETVRATCASHLVVAPDGRAGPAGALLLGRLIKGPQELTWSDTSTDTVARIWRTYGGQVDSARIADWRLILRPGRWLADTVGSAARSRLRREGPATAPAPEAEGAASGHSGVPARIQDAMRAVGGRSHASQEGVAADDASPEEVAAELGELTRGLGLFIDYDATHLEHMLRLSDESPEIPLPPVSRIVRRQGRAIGWYVYLPARTGVSRVLHLAVPRPADVPVVTDNLIQHAHELGCVVLAGRAEPHLIDHLRDLPVLLGLARRPIFHARDPELRAIIATPAAMLSRLDGEWFAA